MSKTRTQSVPFILKNTVHKRIPNALALAFARRVFLFLFFLASEYIYISEAATTHDGTDCVPAATKRNKTMPNDDKRDRVETGGNRSSLE